MAKHNYYPENQVPPFGKNLISQVEEQYIGGNSGT